MSEVRSQMIDDGSQKSRVRLENERRGIIDHASEHRSDFLTLFNEESMIFFGHVSAVTSEVEPGISFAILSICIRQLAYKMCFVPALRPRLSQVRTHGSG